MWGPFLSPSHVKPAHDEATILLAHQKRSSHTPLLDALCNMLPCRNGPSSQRDTDPNIWRDFALIMLHWAALQDKTTTLPRNLRTSFNATSSAQSDALWILGEHHFWGTHGAPRNLTLALAYYERLASKDNATAHGRIGFLRSNLVVCNVYGIPNSTLLSNLHYSMGTQGGDWHARNALAYRHHYGLGMPQDQRKAVTLYAALADEAYKTFQAGPPGGRTIPYNKASLDSQAILSALGDFDGFIPQENWNKRWRFSMRRFLPHLHGSFADTAAVKKSVIYISVICAG